jgi:8-oxo-dGTP pyrophosphatase MutT (NUDIX family)
MQGRWPFPAGRIDPGETPMETALRETWEEIGIASEKIEVLGSLSELFVDVSGFLIQPFVGWLSEKPVFTINKAEVEKILLFPVTAIQG